MEKLECTSNNVPHCGSSSFNTMSEIVCSLTKALNESEAEKKEMKSKIAELKNQLNDTKSLLEIERNKSALLERQLEQSQTEKESLLKTIHPFSTFTTTANRDSQTLAAIQSEMFATEREKTLVSAALQAANLPLEAGTDNKRQRQHGELDWSYFDNLVDSNNMMSDLNNSTAKTLLNFLYQKKIINEKFHLNRRYNDNIACFLAIEFRKRVHTSTQWSIYEKLFHRRNLRTVARRTMKPSDRVFCRKLAEQFDTIEQINTM